MNRGVVRRTCFGYLGWLTSQSASIKAFSRSDVEVDRGAVGRQTHVWDVNPCFTSIFPQDEGGRGSRDHWHRGARHKRQRAYGNAWSEEVAYHWVLRNRGPESHKHSALVPSIGLQNVWREDRAFMLQLTAGIEFEVEPWDPSMTPTRCDLWHRYLTNYCHC